MTHPHGGPPGERTVSWPGVTVGLVAVPVTVFSRLPLVEPVRYLLFTLAVVAIGFVLAKPYHPFWRGVATGLVAGVGIGLIGFAGLCLTPMGRL